MSHILRSTPSTLSQQFYNAGEPADPGTVTIDITRADGSSLVSGGSTLGSGSAPRTFALDGQDDLDDLEVIWTGTIGGKTVKLRSHAEIVGRYLFSEAEARAFRTSGGDTPLSDGDVYTDAILTRARQDIANLLGDYTGVQWVPRFRRIKIAGPGGNEIDLPNYHINRIISVKVSGSAVTDFELDPSNGVLYRTAGTWTGPRVGDPLNIAIAYEHGFEYDQDGVGRMALMWLASTALHKNVSDRAQSIAGELGQINLSPFLPSGVAEVDEWIRRHTFAVRS